jgi:hypothetical protein
MAVVVWSACTPRRVEDDWRWWTGLRLGHDIPDRPREGMVPFTCDARTSHVMPLGISWDECTKASTLHVSHWTMLPDGSPHENASGAGRPFWPVCIDEKCGRALERVPATVGIVPEMHHDDTPALGWCACICCKQCVTTMPLLICGWRACPCCGDKRAHQVDFLTCPLTEEGRECNVHLEREHTTERRKRIDKRKMRHHVKAHR